MSKTFVSELQARLEQNGMFDSQAKAVMQSMLEGEADSSMAQRWTDDPDAYPPVMLNVLWVTCASYALKYIDKHCPQAWFRPCFLPASEQAAFLTQTQAKEST